MAIINGYRVKGRLCLHSHVHIWEVDDNLICHLLDFVTPRNFIFSTTLSLISGVESCLKIHKPYLIPFMTSRTLRVNTGS